MTPLDLAALRGLMEAAERSDANAPTWALMHATVNALPALLAKCEKADALAVTVKLWLDVIKLGERDMGYTQASCRDAAARALAAWDAGEET